MTVINSGFGGRGGSSDPRLPPGQTHVYDWPVLSTGPTPNVDESRWSFTITTEDEDCQNNRHTQQGEQG